VGVQPACPPIAAIERFLAGLRRVVWVAVVDVAEDFVGWQGLGLVVVGVGYSCVLVMEGCWVVLSREEKGGGGGGSGVGDGGWGIYLAWLGEGLGG